MSKSAKVRELEKVIALHRANANKARSRGDKALEVQEMMLVNEAKELLRQEQW